MILALLAGCNQYDLFLVEDGTGGRPNDADVLFVIDGSESMVEESVSLAENFGRFVTTLSARQQALTHEGLPDAVSNYADYVQDPGAFVDFQLAITSIDAGATSGALYGKPTILGKDDPNVAGSFLKTLLCDAACFPNRSSVESAPGYTCDQGFTGKISREFLDCVCGDSWLDNCSGGTEEGVEAVYDAMCRAVEDPPPECFDAGTLTPADARSNLGLLRPGATFVPIVVTDEGDSSPRVPKVQAVPQVYGTLFAALGVPTVWAAIDPALNENFEVVCPTGATSWGLMRYAYLVDASGGQRIDIDGPGCGEADWGAVLDQIGNLVGGGIRSFVLPRDPDPRTIVVELAGNPIGQSSSVGENLFGAPLYTDGWTYDPELHAVVLHGDVIPAPGEDVRIWYYPLK